VAPGPGDVHDEGEGAGGVEMRGVETLDRVAVVVSCLRGRHLVLARARPVGELADGAGLVR